MDNSLEFSISQSQNDDFPAAHQEVCAELKVGEPVEARYRGEQRYYQGKITARHDDGTYDIDYDDGEKESNVSLPLIRSIASSMTSQLRVGSKVEARYRGQQTYYPGVVHACRPNSTFDIAYDNGESEASVPRNLIKSVETSDQPQISRMRIGTKIEARYRGKSKYCAGIIASANLDGTYNIDYDDGEKESSVAETLIRVAGDSRPASSTGFGVGSKIEARYQGKSKFYSGVIASMNPDGTYNIDYDDGEQEVSVAETLIRATSGSTTRESAPSPKFGVGTKIEARYRGKAKYYPGVIASINPDGSYDIDYDDGEHEAKISETLIRAAGGAAKKASEATSKFVVGTKIEARYRGKSKYYPGVIASLNSDSTYDVNYDDGEKEASVAETLIRAVSCPTMSESASSPKFGVGTKIEARYRGKAKYYAGIVASLNADGTYNVDYDDGEHEANVFDSLIREATGTRGGESSSSPPKFGIGTKIESRYRGKSKYYAGVIAVVNSDGTFNVDYDDGEKEASVPEALIRARSGVSSVELPSLPKFGVGTKIEARYRGKSKYYAGIIASINPDGTHNIDYDEGEKESNVSGSLIRVRGQDSRCETEDNKERDDDHLTPLDESAEEMSGFTGARKVGSADHTEAHATSLTETSAGSALDQSQQSTSKLLAAANAIKKGNRAAAQQAASNLAAAARELEIYANQHTAAGLNAAAKAVQTKSEDVVAHLADAVAEDAARVKDALEKAAVDDEQLEIAAKTILEERNKEEKEGSFMPAMTVPSPEKHPGGLGMPWVEGRLNPNAHLAARSLLGQRRPREQQQVSRMQRTLLARSVTFGTKEPKSRRRGDDSEAFDRLSAAQPKTTSRKRATTRGKDRLHLYGSFDDAKNCVFHPRVRGDTLGETKKDSDAENEKEDDGNFVQRQEAWCRKVRKEKEFLIGKKDYDLRQDKKVCPKCGTTQAFDEYEQKKKKCVECGVDYVKPNRGNVTKFLSRLDAYRRESEAQQRELERGVWASITQAWKLTYKNGRIEKVPLFPYRDPYVWDSFLDRLEVDQEKRRAAALLHSPSDPWQHASTAAYFDGDVVTPRYTTLEPHLFTRSQTYGAEAKSTCADSTYGRAAKDASRRQAKAVRWEDNGGESKKWWWT